MVLNQDNYVIGKHFAFQFGMKLKYKAKSISSFFGFKPTSNKYNQLQSLDSKTVQISWFL